jgi:hypothetical protein
VTEAAAIPPKVTVAPSSNPLPAIVTVVPPVTGPELGETLLTVGGAVKVKAPASVADCESGLVTVIPTVPELSAGVTASIRLELTTVTVAAATLPNTTAAPPWKPVPVIATVVPPLVGPEVGETLLTVGGTVKVKAVASVADCESGLVTMIPTVPALSAGVTALICVELLTVTEVATTLPNATVAPAWKPMPVIVTDVPPVTGPELGETLLTVGGAANVKAAARVADCESGLVTVIPTVPALSAGVTALICVELTTVTTVATTLPNVTVAPAWKAVPVIVTVVPPAVAPDAGEIPVTVKESVYVNPFASVAD